MEIDRHLDALRADLAAAADLGDDTVRRVAEHLARALEPSLRLRLQDLLAEAAVELNGQLPGGHVELRIGGDDVGLVYRDPPAEQEAQATEDAALARITLRLPDGLKTRAEKAAAAEGLSLNAWLVRATANAVGNRRGGRDGRRITGYAAS